MKQRLERRFGRRGRRIKRWDDRLVLWSVIFHTLFCILAVSCVVYGNKLFLKNQIAVTKNEIQAGIVGGSVLSASVLLICYRKTGFRKLIKCQRLARMILENGWFESEIIPKRNYYRKITYFPSLYYREAERKIFITVKISMGKYQEKLLHLEDKLETGLACELVEKDTQGVYMRYTFLQEVEQNRISIAEVKAERGRLPLMKHICWNYDSMPHMLIAGVTGGGKTYFLMTIIEALLRTNAELYIADPKNMDLAFLGRVLPEVHYEKEAILNCIERFYADMVKQTSVMKEMADYRMGMNYADLGFPPHFLVFDEYVAFMDMLGKKEWEEPMSLIRKIIMLGRQAGFFLILACQRPDAKYLGDGVRDQFGFRVALGEMSDSGYNMMFGSTEKDYTEKHICGRGYVNTGNAVITEFYTPLVPKGHDFFNEIRMLYNQRKSSMSVKLQKLEPGEKQEV